MSSFGVGEGEEFDMGAGFEFRVSIVGRRRRRRWWWWWLEEVVEDRCFVRWIVGYPCETCVSVAV